MEKVGFHYRLDSDHYSEKDLAVWLPRLKDLGASWLVLLAPTTRAIPEGFINGLKAAKIEPVLHFPITPDKLPAVEEMILLFENYHRWGVKYIILFDRPNMQDGWTGESWAQAGLTERFLDCYLPLAEAAVAVGLAPIFPPLEPGGDYWDTTFLRNTLDGIHRRASKPLQDRLILSAYAGFNGRALSWGAGGPQSWPETQPYLTPDSSQDQIGFRIADWYLTLSETILERKTPLFLLGICGPVPAGQDLVEAMTKATRLISRKEVQGLDPLPEEVVAGAIFCLTSSGNCCSKDHSWFSPEGEPKPIVESFRNHIRQSEDKVKESKYQISHYLLLPSFEWGVSDWHLNVTKSFIKKHRPTVGFSLEEAFQAEQVTVVGGKDHFSEQDITRLRNHGCYVRQVEGDGTKIASSLAAI